MFSFIRDAVVMASLHNNKILTKTVLWSCANLNFHHEHTDFFACILTSPSFLVKVPSFWVACSITHLFLISQTLHLTYPSIIKEMVNTTRHINNVPLWRDLKILTSDHFGKTKGHGFYGGQFPWSSASGAFFLMRALLSLGWSLGFISNTVLLLFHEMWWCLL